MTTIAEQMQTAITNLQVQHNMTADQINAIVAKATAPLQAQIAQITASEGDDASKIGDITAALSEFTSAFGGSADQSPAPSPDPAPAPAPSPEPAPAPVAA